MRQTSFVVCGIGILAAAMVSLSAQGGSDWPMWGGTPSRNMVSDMKGAPTSWDMCARMRMFSSTPIAAAAISSGSDSR